QPQTPGPAPLSSFSACPILLAGISSFGSLLHLPATHTGKDLQQHERLDHPYLKSPSGCPASRVPPPPTQRFLHRRLHLRPVAKRAKRRLARSARVECRPHIQKAAQRIVVQPGDLRRV